MNIIVRPYGSELCYCRPDTTWEKEGRDLYVPDGVNKILWAPVAFARVSKAGKCVNYKFVTRYYDAIGFGTLLYSDDKELAFSSCMDHSSLLPMPLYDPVVLGNDENVFHMSVGTHQSQHTMGKNIQELMEAAICKASERITLRIGDLVAVELSSLEEMAEGQNSETEIKGRFQENDLFDLKVIF